jgi:hypothetical protein
MGLLSNLIGSGVDDPRFAATTQLAQGLLSSPRLMQGLSAGLGGYQQAMAQARQQKAVEELRQMQLADARMKMEAAQREQAKEQGIESAYRNAMRTPEQMAMAQNGGPTLAAAQAAPGMQGGFDQNALMRGLAQADPMKAFQMMQPEKPNFVNVDGALVQTNAQGGPRSVFERNKPAEMPTAVREYQFAQSQGYRGTFQQFQMEKARAGASNTSVSFGTPVAAVDAQGNPVFIQPSKDGSAPHIIPGLRPPRSAAEERSDGERRDRGRQGQQMMSVMQDAESILRTGRATSSGLGNLADASARVFGVSTPGAQDAARLEALSGWLVANVPRMEGPQSNIDVQNYTTMAGKVGDRTIPLPERLAALQQVRGLQQKYAAINGTPMAEPPQPGGAPKVIDFNALPR